MPSFVDLCFTASADVQKVAFSWRSFQLFPRYSSIVRLVHGVCRLEEGLVVGMLVGRLGRRRNDWLNSPVTRTCIQLVGNHESLVLLQTVNPPGKGSGKNSGSMRSSRTRYSPPRTPASKTISREYSRDSERCPRA